LKYRTDLAIERKEILDSGSKKAENAKKQKKHEEHKESRESSDGIDVDVIDWGDDVKVTRIEIKDEYGAMKMEKPIGNYITIEAAGIQEERDGIKERVEGALVSELKRLIKFHYYLKVLVAGLGNSMVTPDALGPKTASKIRVTNHLFEMFQADGDDEMSRVSCIAPGVTGTTGMESAEMVKKAAEIADPEVVIVVDSLAARDIRRVSTTIQVTDTGISPGSGMGNHRTGINSDSLGRRVIAIGVPTVIDATTIIRDALTDNIESDEMIEKYINAYDRQMIVTSTDIDMLIKDFSDIIANGINKTLHPGIYS